LKEERETHIQDTIKKIERAAYQKRFIGILEGLSSNGATEKQIDKDIKAQKNSVLSS
jgi:hypothetical protein